MAAGFKNEESLHSAIQVGALEEVKKLVGGGADMDHVFGMRGTALCAAIEAKNLNIARFLINAGCDVNAQDFDGEPPLLLALRKEKPRTISLRTECLEIASLLIRNPKCNVNKIDPLTKKSAIHFATEQGMTEVVHWLLSSACDINKVDINGNTPLHSAVFNGHEDIVDVLVSSTNCLIKVYNKAGMVPLHIASNNGDFRSLKLILNRLKSSSSKNSIDLLKQQLDELELNASGDSIPSTELALNINALTIYEKETCLHLAARNEHKEIIRLLIQAGAKVNLKNNFGQTALLIACGATKTWMKYDNDIPLMLLKAGATPNGKAIIRNRYVARDLEVTCLILSAINNNVELTRALVSNGADPQQTDNQGRVPLFVALWENSIAVAKFLLQECSGLSVNVQNMHGQTPLHAVLKCSNKGKADEKYELIQLLMKKGATVMPDNDGVTPLLSCMEYEDQVTLDAILASSEIFPDEIVYDVQTGYTLLHTAVGIGCLPIVQVLLSHGDNIDHISPEGHTPLFVALENDQLSVAKFLVNNGCDLLLERYIVEMDDVHESPASNKKHNAAVFDHDSDDDDDGDDDESDDDFDDDDDDDDDDYGSIKNDKKVAQWLRSVAMTPRTLCLSCLLVIRKHFRDHRLKFSMVDMLPVPGELIRMLRYKEGSRH